MSEAVDISMETDVADGRETDMIGADVVYGKLMNGIWSDFDINILWPTLVENVYLRLRSSNHQP